MTSPTSLITALRKPGVARATAVLLFGIALPLAAATLYFGGILRVSAAKTVMAQINATAPGVATGRDDDGWQTLARSQLKAQQYREAADTYAKAVAASPSNPQLLADYAYALAMANGRNLDGEPMELLEAALKIDPNHQRSLALAGQGAFNHGDYAQALGYWQRLLATFPPGSDGARAVAERISHAQMAEMAASASAGVIKSPH
jgi:cytochrome c-type biogenesis protein CcmH